MPSGNILGIGTSALLSYQRALNTVSHNVANVNTPGYSRQQVELSTLRPQPSGSGFIGNGVKVDTVERMYDQFLTNEVRTHTASHKEVETLHVFSSRLDNLLADENAGLNTSMNAFFAAAQGVADDPTSTAARQVMLSEADTLSARFQDLNRWLQDNRSELNAQLGVTTDEINQLTGAIADINNEIVTSQIGASGQPPNDLLDKRDLLIEELSQRVSVNTVAQDDGSLNIFTGSGQALVLGNMANSLGVQRLEEDPGQVEITLNAGGAAPVPITSLLSGGSIGGLLRYRNQVLDPAQNELGQLAVGIASFTNEQHRKGMTLDGSLGQDLFTVAEPQVLASTDNSGTISVAFDNVAQLGTDDFRLAFDGSNWTLSRVSSGQPVALSGSGTAADPFTAEGLSIVVGAGAAAGDNYLIRPTRNAAGDIGVALSSPGDLALAMPIRTETALSNTGTGTVTSSEITDIDNPAFQSVSGELTPPVLVRFTSPTSYEVLNKTTLATIDTGSYDPATGADIFPTENSGIDYGYRIHIGGSPAAGDEFTVEYNTDGVGDNRNALLLGGLQEEQLMDEGTTSFTDAYGQMVAEVGNRARQAEVNSDAQQRILEQSVSARDSVSGVNLDEEAADLIRFQQAYEAAAQVIAVADQIFESLISALRR